jgi:hypothetical protein
VTEPHAARRLPGTLGLAAARPRITPAARDHAPLGAPPVPCTRPTGKGGILGLTPSRPRALAAPDARSPVDPAHAWGARVGRPPRSGAADRRGAPRTRVRDRRAASVAASTAGATGSSGSSGRRRTSASVSPTNMSNLCLRGPLPLPPAAMFRPVLHGTCPNVASGDSDRNRLHPPRRWRHALARFSHPSIRAPRCEQARRCMASWRARS